MPTKLIEVALPLDVINREAAREKSIRHGHPSTLHLWWARRPLAACRAVLFAQLVDDPSAHPDRFPTLEAQDAERQRLFRIIERLVPWEASNNEAILEEARAEIRKCYPDGPPAIVDPFCGGGSIPLEAQRLGLEARASDLNPVAVLITKALIELPPKFAGRPPVHPADSGTLGRFDQEWKGAAGLADDVHWYGHWMRDRAEERIGHLYPKATLSDGSTATVIAWLWVRTVTCPNPACGSTMPLVKSFWLGKKKGKEAWVNPIPEPEHKRVRFEIGHGRQGPPIDGTKTGRGANFTCLCCGNPAHEDYVHQQIDDGKSGAQLMAVVAEGRRQRVYLPADPLHEAAADVKAPLDAPDQPARGTFGGNAQGRRYGFRAFADYFTNRQLTALCTLNDLVGDAIAKVRADSGGDIEYSAAVGEYLALATSRLTDMNNSLVTWSNSRDQTRHLFARQAIPMTWDYAEVNPFGGAAGDLGVSLTSAVKVIKVLPGVGSGRARQAEAAKVSDSNAVLSTDPPYYDNIGYADLSDFFYVWLRRSLRTVDPELFGTLLTPKSAELVANPYRFNGNKQLAEKHFETGFADAFARAGAETLAGTPMTVFYAFKQSEEDSHDGEFLAPRIASTGWEKMLEGLMRAGLSVTGTWPMRTERAVRSVGIGTNVLASSIILVCRPRPETAGLTDRRGFQQALRNRLAAALRDLQSGGVAPVDLAQASIGPGMAVFSSYAKVVEPNGGAMSVRTALGLINQVLDEVTAEQEGEFDEHTRWAVAWYAEHGMDDGPFGRADDLSRAKNVSVEGLVRAGIVKSGAGKVRLLDRSDLDPDWDPAKDTRLTTWEVTQQLIRRLLDESEASAAELLARVGGLGEPARDLAYRPFQIAESKKWAKEAGPYNALAAAWPELSRRAALGQNVQETLT